MRLALLAAALTALHPQLAWAQANPSDFTYGTRYDANGRVVGTIAPDPDGAGALRFLATRNVYDGNGRLIRTEQGELAQWQSESVLPSDWPGFSIHSTVEIAYDAAWRKIKETASNGSTPFKVTQFSYDGDGRLECTAVRMNPAAFAALPASACTLGSQGAHGPDRITKNVYDAAAQLVQVFQGWGTPGQQAYATYGYSRNGKRTALIDAGGNKATFSYDGFDRQIAWNFPSKMVTGEVSATDYEQYGYDANGNRTSLRKRDGRTIAYSYDALNRVTSKTYPGGGARPVYYAYDLRGLQTMARFDSLSGQGITNAYDGFGRLTATTAVMNLGATEAIRNLNFAYDANGNRTRIWWPDGQHVDSSWDGLDRLYYSGVSGLSVGLIHTPYNAAGQLSGLYRYNISASQWAFPTSFSYDGISRLASYSHSFQNSAANVTTAFSYNPASQVISRARDNDDYRFNGHTIIDRSYVRNGLNQYTSAGSASFTYDANGNLTSDGTTSFTYDIENRLVSTSAGVTLSYDPLGRLAQTYSPSTGTTQFVYDGDALVAEYDGTGAMTKRYAHGPAAGVDDPLVEYIGSSVTSPRYLFADHQGSIMAIADSNGNRIAVNSYDEYGIPNGFVGSGTPNTGRFQYTGQAWIPELGMYHYKARIYSPTLGRFLQTDPVGYDDQVNLYAYAGNDAVNNLDPGGDRFVTAGEQRALERVFGSLMRESYRDIYGNRTQIMEVDTPSRPVSWGNTITMPRSVYADDYTNAVSISKRNTFWHEFYHEFEYRAGISTPGGLFINQLKFGFNEERPYKYDPDKTFFQNNPEARASYFAGCMTGGDCSHLKGLNEKIGNGITVKFNEGKFIVYVEDASSRIARRIN